MVKWFYVQTLNPWRKDFFPNYKHSRKMARQNGPFLIGIYVKIITEIKKKSEITFLTL